MDKNEWFSIERGEPIKTHCVVRYLYSVQQIVNKRVLSKSNEEHKTTKVRMYDENEIRRETRTSSFTLNFITLFMVQRKDSTTLLNVKVVGVLTCEGCTYDVLPL